MKIIYFKDSKFIPASHEEARKPGVWKKVLLEKKDFIRGRVQMINWAKLPYGKAFKPHYHEDMQEVFVILKGKARIKVAKETAILTSGDAVSIPSASVHQMENRGSGVVEYLVIGISQGKNGKTIVVEEPKKN